MPLAPPRPLSPFSLKLQPSLRRQLRLGKEPHKIYQNKNPLLKISLPVVSIFALLKVGLAAHAFCGFRGEAASPLRRRAGEFFPAEVATLIRPRRGGDLCETAGPPTRPPL